MRFSECDMLDLICCGFIDIEHVSGKATGNHVDLKIHRLLLLQFFENVLADNVIRIVFLTFMTQCFMVLTMIFELFWNPTCIFSIARPTHTAEI